MCRFSCVRVCCSVGMQCCAAEDNLDMVSASAHMLALLGGGVCPVAGRHSFFYEGRISPWWRSHSRYGSGGISPPLFQRAVLSLDGDPVRVAIYTGALTGSRVLILADAWSRMITCRRVLCVINIHLNM